MNKFKQLSEDELKRLTIEAQLILAIFTIVTILSVLFIKGMANIIFYHSVNMLLTIPSAIFCGVFLKRVANNKLFYKVVIYLITVFIGCLVSVVIVEISNVLNINCYILNLY